MEISIIIIAFILGLTSSLHCVGMCGPIAFSLGLNPENKVDFTFRNLTYQFGRITTYTILGIILGFVGQGFSIVGLQNPLSIFAGFLMILLAFLPKNISEKGLGTKSFSRIMMHIKMNLAKFLRQKKYSSLYLTGILNGLLPCGAVYAALTGAIAAGSIGKGAMFMFFFGLGTIPLMFASVLAGNIVSVSVRQKILNILPWIMVFLGILFIIRGLNLNIPFVSPALEGLKIGAENHSH